MSTTNAVQTDSLKIELNGKQLNPRELTVQEVETVIESLSNEETHVLEAMCPDQPIPATAVALSVDVEVDELKGLVPSVVPELFKQVREKNQFLAQAVETLGAIAEKAQQEDLIAQQEALKNSGDQSAS